MDTAQIVFLVCAVVLFIVSGLLAEWKLSVSATSRRELKRQSELGAQSARAALGRNDLIPRLKVVRSFLFILSFTLAVVTLLQVIGVLWTIVGSVVVSIVFIRLRQLPFIHKTINHITSGCEKKLLAQVSTWNWLSGLEHQESEQPIEIRSVDELQVILTESSSALGKPTLRRLRAAISFDGQLVSDVMTPLSEVETISQDEILGPLVLDDLYKTGYSRFPVIAESVDQVVGILYLPKAAQLTKQSSSAEATMDAHPVFIREDQSLLCALHGFLRSNHHLAIVVNEQSETVGVLSIGDVIEAVLGEEIICDFDQSDNLKAVAATSPHYSNTAKGKHT